MKLFKKITAVALSLIMCLSMAAFTVSAETTNTDDTEIVIDDFESYSGKTLKFNSSWSDSTVGLAKGFSSNWFGNAYNAATYTANSDIEMKTVADGDSNNVLQLSGNTSWNGPILTRLVASTSGYKPTGYELSQTGELVVSIKIKTAANSASGTALFAVVPGSAVQVHSTNSSMSVIGGTSSMDPFYHALATNSTGAIISKNFTLENGSTFTLDAGKWHTIKFVYDLSSTAATTPCTIYSVTDGTETNWGIANLNSTVPGKLSSILGFSIIPYGESASVSNQYDDFSVVYIPQSQGSDNEGDNDGQTSANFVTVMKDEINDYTNTLSFTGTATQSSVGLVDTAFGKNWHANAFDANNYTINEQLEVKTVTDGTDSVLQMSGKKSWLPVVMTRLVSTKASTYAPIAYTLPTEGTLKITADVKIDQAASATNVLAVVPGNGMTCVNTTSNMWVVGSRDSTMNAFYHALKTDASGNIVPTNFTLADSEKTFSLASGKWHTITFEYDLSAIATNGTTPCTISTTTAGEVTNWGTATLTTSTQGALTSLVGITTLIARGNASDTDKVDVKYDDFTVQISEHIKADAAGEFVTGTGYVADITATSIANSAKDIWCVVAAYGENNKLIDAKIADFGSVAANTPVSMEDITLANATAENTRRVCVLVWDGSDTMVPYMQPITIYPAQ